MAATGVSRCADIRLVPGDELRLRYKGDATHAEWNAIGHVIRLTASFDLVGGLSHCADEEVALELRGATNAPTDVTMGFSVDFVWKSTTYDRF